MVYSSVTTVKFFFKQLSHLRPIFVNLSTEKHFYCQLIVAFEKKTLKLKLKEDEIIGGKKECYFRRLFGLLHGKQGNFEGIVYFLCLVNEISRKSFPIN